MISIGSIGVGVDAGYLRKKICQFPFSTHQPNEIRRGQVGFWEARRALHFAQQDGTFDHLAFLSLQDRGWLLPLPRIIADVRQPSAAIR
jgi:hypothetical protein